LVSAMKGMARESPREPILIEPRTRDIIQTSTFARSRWWTVRRLKPSRMSRTCSRKPRCGRVGYGTR
jgi:hypothetical protein